ncbi:rhodanese-like domain-containing protein, partial [Arthrobacter sp. L77]|uniref:rhodanese-like domain-containing protein n=1 Tax=Arthrobacter sp. L77 TaxID=1496689 RepID=UPI002F3F2B77
MQPRHRPDAGAPARTSAYHYSRRPRRPLVRRRTGGCAEQGRASHGPHPRQPEHPAGSTALAPRGPTDTTLYLVCGSGKRSSQAARMLDGHGYTTVNVAGGITEWYRRGHPATYAPAAGSTQNVAEVCVCLPMDRVCARTRPVPGP